MQRNQFEGLEEPEVGEKIEFYASDFIDPDELGFVKEVEEKEEFILGLNEFAQEKSSDKFLEKEFTQKEGDFLENVQSLLQRIKDVKRQNGLAKKLLLSEDFRMGATMNHTQQIQYLDECIKNSADDPDNQEIWIQRKEKALSKLRILMLYAGLAESRILTESGAKALKDKIYNGFMSFAAGVYSTGAAIFVAAFNSGGVESMPYVLGAGMAGSTLHVLNRRIKVARLRKEFIATLKEYVDLSAEIEKPQAVQRVESAQRREREYRDRMMLEKMRWDMERVMHKIDSEQRIDQLEIRAHIHGVILDMKGQEFRVWSKNYMQEAFQEGVPSGDITAKVSLEYKKMTEGIQKTLESAHDLSPFLDMLSNEDGIDISSYSGDQEK